MGLKNSDIVGRLGPEPAIVTRPPPPRLSAHLLAFVRRDERAPAQVQRLLPELRASLQVRLADAYVVRERDGDWQRVPDVSLWAPKHRWCYGYCQGRVTVYALGLSMTGLRALGAPPVADCLNRILDLDTMDSWLAQALRAQDEEPFDAWTSRVGALLEVRFSERDCEAEALQSSIAVLATESGDAVARAASLIGLSERHYRRRFRQWYGVAPKCYQRLLRVDRLLRQLHERPWDADEHGSNDPPFADQPHAIREFRHLTGLTPEAYRRAKRGGDATMRSVTEPMIEPPSGFRGEERD